MNKPSTRAARLPVDGVLLLDKPEGLTSNDALIRARRLFSARKAGHGGTLDPLATGLLPILFGEASKFAQDSLLARKTYLADIRLGITTETADREGRVLEQRPVAVTLETVQRALERFVGVITQVPPMYSALKRDGRPLHEYARQGITLERQAREVTIDSLDLLAFAGDRLQIRVTCSKGTYVRTLAQDIGEALSCGAHLHGLRRERIGAIGLESAVTLEAIEAHDPSQRASLLRPPDALAQSLVVVQLDATLARRFLNGQRIRLAEIPMFSDGAPRNAGLEATDADVRVRVYEGERLLGVASVVDAVLHPARLIAHTSVAHPSIDQPISSSHPSACPTTESVA